MFPYVERGIENLLDGERMLRRLVDLDMGEVRIGASDMTLQFYLLPHLERPWPVSQYQGHGIQRPDTGDIQSLYEEGSISVWSARPLTPDRRWRSGR